MTLQVSRSLDIQCVSTCQVSECYCGLAVTEHWQLASYHQLTLAHTVILAQSDMHILSSISGELKQKRRVFLQSSLISRTMLLINNFCESSNLKCYPTYTVGSRQTCAKPYYTVDSMQN